MKCFKITPNDTGQRLDKFILKVTFNLPKTLMYRYIRQKKIKVNGKRADFNSCLNTGDIVEMYINDTFFKEKSFTVSQELSDLEIIYEDTNLLALNKPAGMLVHPDENQSGETLVHKVQSYLVNKGEYSREEENSFAPALANRLDRNTSGLVIAAKNAAALRELNEIIRQKGLGRYYLCAVEGHVNKSEDTITTGYMRDKAIKKTSTGSLGNIGAMQTHYRLIEAGRDKSLLEIELITGKTHQIRAHLSGIGHPIIGDKKYGAKGIKDYGLELCAYKLTFLPGAQYKTLNYLSGKTIMLKEVPFLKDFNYSIANIDE